MKGKGTKQQPGRERVREICSGYSQSVLKDAQYTSQLFS